ncbi:MAG: hypothetical protein HY263_02875 [Chloroflexi bacterium]|nr:hypothetical protein [Chloroflexota bacterium]
MTGLRRVLGLVTVPGQLRTPAREIVGEARVRMAIWPWTDCAFVAAVEDCWTELSGSPDVEPSSPAGAARAQACLRAAGYSSARVLDQRSVDEALQHVAHWRVVRDPAT